MTMSWSGRELQSITKDSNTHSFTYNLNGLRTKKNSNGTNTFYYYDDRNNLNGLKKGNTTVLFYYDQNGFGYYPQVYGILTPYVWEAKYTYYRWYSYKKGM